MTPSFVSRVDHLHRVASTKISLVCDFNPSLSPIAADIGDTEPLGTWHFEVRMPLLDALAPPRYQPPRFAFLAVGAAFVLQPMVDMLCGAAVLAAAVVVGRTQGPRASVAFVAERYGSVAMFGAALVCLGLAWAAPMASAPWMLRHT